MSLRLFVFASAILAAGPGAASAQAPVVPPIVVEAARALGADAFARPIFCATGQTCAVVSPAIGHVGTVQPDLKAFAAR